MIDAATQRKNMIDSQVRPSDVSDRRIIRAMHNVPRELFVPSNIRALSYMDNDLKIRAADATGPERYLLAPRLQAKLLQLADIAADDLVLDIGCASGYSTAILAQIADSVVGLEVVASLAEQASKNLAKLSIDNAAVVTGSLETGLATEGPYDVIVLNGAVPDVPATLVAQLKPGGRLVTVLSSDKKTGSAALVHNVDGRVDYIPSFDAGTQLLPGFIHPPVFAL
jgi:protein-L-isoaspartate(D-aspartate) O-methyltransferase